MIKQLSQQVAQDLCAQQVITNICDCIKQLVDNSIDAHSTQISIYLNDYGKKYIQISDNGCGIANFQFLAKKGSTSKNKGDKQQILTLGFRGQALHSLGKVSQKMSITSSTDGTTTILFDVKNQKQKQILTTKQKGTTVRIQSLFQFLPVRRYQLMIKCKQFLKKTDEMIRQYCLIYPKISFSLRNTRELGQDLLISATQIGNEDKHTQQQIWKSRIQLMLGSKVTQSLIYLNTSLLKGWILKNIESGSSRQNTFIRKNMHYMFLNNRPIDPLPKIVNVLDSYYKKYNRSTKYAFIINLVLPWDTYDVNLAPNKRQILIRQNLLNKIIQQLKQFIDKNVIQDIPVLKDYQDKIKTKERMSNFLKSNSKSENIYNKEKSQSEYQIRQNKDTNIQQNDKLRKTNDNQRKINYQSNTITRIQKVQSTPSAQLINKFKHLDGPNQSKSQINNKANFNQKLSETIKSKISVSESKINNASKNKLIESLNQRMSIGSKKLKSPQYVTFKQLGIKKNNEKSNQQNDKSLIKVQQIQEKQNQKISMQIKNESGSSNLNQMIRQQLQQQSKSRLMHATLARHQKNDEQQISKSININLSISRTPQQRLESKIGEQENVLHEKTVHNIEKSAFEQFKVVGQFNHGFIVCYFEQKYYLVDQHAASQKYHFQKIMKSAKNKSQIHKYLQLNPIEVQNVQQHKNSLQEDGYLFQIQNGSIFLKQVPVFLQKVYGKSYFLDLASTKSKLCEHPDYYNSAATKACRTAVMVGDVLQPNQMKSIVQQLSRLNSPWNCPHGRPTLIYLGHRSQIQNLIGSRKRQYSLQ